MIEESHHEGMTKKKVESDRKNSGGETKARAIGELKMVSYG